MRALLRPCLLLLAAVWRSEVLPAACRAADWDCQVRGRGETEHGDGSLPSGYSYPPGVSAKSASASAARTTDLVSSKSKAQTLTRYRLTK